MMLQSSSSNTMSLMSKPSAVDNCIILPPCVLLLPIMTLVSHKLKIVVLQYSFPTVLSALHFRFKHNFGACRHKQQHAFLVH